MAQSVAARSFVSVRSLQKSFIKASQQSGVRLNTVAFRRLSSAFYVSPLKVENKPTLQWNPLPAKPTKISSLLKDKSKTTGSTGSQGKTEDGIFGTSGGFGFTKQNELFVGRVAMLGFAASILGEALTGKGTLEQFDIETGIPLNETEPLLLFFILFTLLGAIGALGDRGKFVDEPQTPFVVPGKGIKGALGLNEKGPTFGFTKANELFVGRLAQLGIAFAIIGEIITGKGALAQLNIETGVPISELEPLIIFNVIFFFLAAINPGTGKFINDDDVE